MIPYRSYKESIDRRFEGSRIVWGTGHPNANVMLVGWRPLPGEIVPFSIHPNAYLRVINAVIGVPDPLLFYNYLFKTSDETALSQDINGWVNVLDQELRAYTKPKAVVLLGIGATEILGQGTQDNFHNAQNIEWHRNARYYSDRYPEINFFVTYDPADMQAEDENGRLDSPHRFVQDMRAIYEANATYFTTKRSF